MPPELPKPGDVYGNPENPETWLLVRCVSENATVDDSRVEFIGFTRGDIQWLRFYAWRKCLDKIKAANITELLSVAGKTKASKEKTYTFEEYCRTFAPEQLRQPHESETQFKRRHLREEMNRLRREWDEIEIIDDEPKPEETTNAT